MARRNFDPFPALSAALTRANRLLNVHYMPKGALDGKEPPALDVGALREALQAAIDCLPAGEDDGDNDLQAPGWNPATKDGKVDHRDDFKSGTAKPTVDSRSGMGLDARRAAALLDVDEIFCGAPAGAHADQTADSTWG